MSQRFPPIAITGRGAIVPGACSVEQFYANLLAGRCFIRDVPSWLWPQATFYSPDRGASNRSYAAIAALAEDPAFNPLEFKIPPATARLMSRSQKMALVAARRALREAMPTPLKSARDRFGVFISAISGGEINEALSQSLAEDLVMGRLQHLADAGGHGGIFKELQAGYEGKHPRLPVHADAMTGSAPNLISGRIASIFDLRGPNFVLDAACASSLAALGCAINTLHTGECDYALAGGVETWVDAGAFVQFSKVGALSENGCFPFDEQADGFVLGEGCGLVVLRRLEDALRDGNHVYGIIGGIGASSDGSDSTGITVPSIAGQVRSMTRAYEAAGIDPARLDYVECHGTGTRVGDPIELNSLQALLGNSSQRKHPLPVASVKASVGHLRTAAGMAGLFNALMVVNRRIIPPQVNFSQPTSAFAWEGSNLRVPVEPVPIESAQPIAGVSGFGFGGINYHVILSAPAEATTRGPSLNKNSSRKKISTHADTAFVFPGQGSQYVGMLGELVRTEAGKKLIPIAEDTVLRLTGKSLLRAIEPENYQGAATPQQVDSLKSTELAQPAIFLASAIMLEVLRDLRIEPGMMLGHSLGEYAALYAAGCFSFAEAIDVVTRRGLLIKSLKDQKPSSMAYLLADRATAATYIKEIGSGLTVANINSYDQHVIAGYSDAIAELIEKARKDGLQADLIPVDRAFHSPLMLPAAAPMRDALARIAIRAPAYPVPANVEQEDYPWSDAADQTSTKPEDRQKIISLLSRQLYEPVDFVGQIERAYAAGIRRFVEVGPRTVLRGLISDILQGKPFQALALDDKPAGPQKNLRTLPGMLSARLSISRKPLSNLRPPDFLPKASKPLGTQTTTVRGRIRSIVAEESGYDPAIIGDDVLFDRDLGIDSLKLIKIISRLRGSVIPTDYLGFRNLTSVARIAEVAEAHRPARRKEPAHFACYAATEVPTAIPEPKSHGSLETGAPAFIRAVGTAAELCGEAIPALQRAAQVFIQRDAAGQDSRRFDVVTYGLDPGMATAWFRSFRGFMLSMAQEFPRHNFSYHHVDAAEVPGDFLQLILTTDGIGLRWSAQRQPSSLTLHPAEIPAAGLDEISRLVKQEDLILVTGGARGIAAACVRALLAKTQARFILIGQRQEKEPWFNEAGAGRIEYIPVDIASLDALRSTGLEHVAPDLIIHAAGISPLNPLLAKTETETKRVMHVKAMGVMNILDVIARSRLRGIVSFSSIVSHFGNISQQDYAAANGFLDGFVPPEGIPHLAIGWTAWSGTGMASRGLVKDIIETSGVETLPVEAGVEWFEKILAWWLSRERTSSTVVEVFGSVGQMLPSSASDALAAIPTSLPAHVALVHADGHSTPIFGFCGIYGHAYRLQLVAGELPGAMPMYALEPPQMDWTTQRCGTLDEMLHFYANTIEQCRAEGPIGLMGTSFGGNIAFEVAKILQSRGRVVSFLALVDTMPPDEDPAEHDELEKVIAAKLAAPGDPVEHAGAKVARHHLDALRKHQSTGIFRGAIHYFLMTGHGWPGRHDRRFSWEALATEGVRLMCLPGIHGEFAADQSRVELAKGLKDIAECAAGEAKTLAAYLNDQCSARIRSTAKNKKTLESGFMQHPVLAGWRMGRMLACQRYQSRLWIKGGLYRLPGSIRSPVHIGLFFDGELIHRVLANQSGNWAMKHQFELVADFYRIHDRHKSIEIIAWNQNGAWQLGAIKLQDYFPGTEPGGPHSSIG